MRSAILTSPRRYDAACDMDRRVAAFLGRPRYCSGDLPLLLSAAIGYVLLDRGVIAEFKDVATRQRDQIDPNQDLRIVLWEATAPIELYLDDGDPAEVAEYRARRERIEAGFARLHRALETEPEAKALAERARDNWGEADGIATEIISVHWTPGDSSALALVKRFDALIERR